MMLFDSSHLRRYLRLQGSTEGDALPFGEPPWVLGNVISWPEPVWETIVAALRSHGARDVFAQWRWQKPLGISQATGLLQVLPSLIDTIKRTETTSYPDTLAEEARPEAEEVIQALGLLNELLSLAIIRRRAVETWAE